MFTPDNREPLERASRNTKLVAFIIQFVVFALSTIVFGLYPTLLNGVLTVALVALINYWAALNVYKSDHPLSYEFDTILKIQGGMMLINIILAILIVLLLPVIF